MTPRRVSSRTVRRPGRSPTGSGSTVRSVPRSPRRSSDGTARASRGLRAGRHRAGHAGRPDRRRCGGVRPRGRVRRRLRMLPLVAAPSSIPHWSTCWLRTPTRCSATSTTWTRGRPCSAECPDLDRRDPGATNSTSPRDPGRLRGPEIAVAPWSFARGRRTRGAAAADAAGLPTADVALVRRAGLVHRLGATGVSTSIWNKTGPLTPMEWERVRTVPYLTERILSHQPRLAGIARIAGMCHERHGRLRLPAGNARGGDSSTGSTAGGR